MISGNMAHFSLGKAMWNQRLKLEQARERLQALAAVGRPGDIGGLPQIAQLFAIAMDYSPDIIIEVGRGYGNSTCVFTEAANQLGEATVVSICLSDTWQKETLPRIVPIVPPNWVSKLDAKVSDVFDVDIRSLTEDKQRILFFWDAHGWEVAEYVLGVVLPVLQDKTHIILVHDIVDLNYHSELRSYSGRPIWKGYLGDQEPVQYVFVGSMGSAFEEVVAIADFAARNCIDIRSGEREIREEIETESDRRAEMIRLLGNQIYSPLSGFHWFTLNSAPDATTLRFPRFQRPAHTWKERTKEEVFASRLVRDLRRFNRHGSPSMATFGLILAKIVIGRYRF